ncbi:hypothetical protein EJB05_48142 [Eragrostis curvula]|uniref:MATH domain-containing protein n=1 Tax=Eragrostis curvula TaxID=38414 RepID=A0A5J9T135_9POAL|nr:hypothetical protein EJB05_48142 [Eragrostis curvula]
MEAGRVSEGERRTAGARWRDERTRHRRASGRQRRSAMARRSGGAEATMLAAAALSPLSRFLAPAASFAIYPLAHPVMATRRRFQAPPPWQRQGEGCNEHELMTAKTVELMIQRGLQVQSLEEIFPMFVDKQCRLTRLEVRDTKLDSTLVEFELDYEHNKHLPIGKVLDSDAFSACGHMWRLNWYPGGEKVAAYFHP